MCGSNPTNPENTYKLLPQTAKEEDEREN